MSVVQAAHRFIPAELNDPEWYPFDRESPMYFDVHEYPLHIQSKKDPQRTMSVDGYKALVRKADGERVVPLAVVGDGYKVVQNKELFGKTVPSTTWKANCPPMPVRWISTAPGCGGRVGT